MRGVRYLTFIIIIIINLFINSYCVRDGYKASLEPMQLKIINDKDYIINVYWANGLHQETFQGSLYPDEILNLNTFEDHILILRCKIDTLLVRTIVVDKDTPTVYASGKEGLVFDNYGYDLSGVTDQELLNLTFSSDVFVDLQGEQEQNARKQYNNNEKRGVMFYNDFEFPVKTLWKGPNGEIFQHRLEHGWDQTVFTFVNHEFIFRNESNNKIISSIRIKPETRYVFVNFRRVDNDFHKAYEKRMGRPWLTVYPRKLPIHSFHPILENDETLTIQTNAPQYHGDLSDIAGDNAHKEFNLQLKMISKQPRIFSIPNFLSDEECDHIIQRVNTSNRLKRSTVTDRAVVLQTRTSANTWMRFDESPILLQIYRRGFAAMNIPFDENTADKIAESLQVLRYDIGQKYTRHQDWFPPFDPGYLHDRSVQRGYNRFATLFLYLNDVEEGGETEFPRYNGVNINDACTNKNGFKAKPSRGDAIIFYTVLPDGNVDLDSLHGGCPVIKGTKFGANWWFWEAKR